MLVKSYLFAISGIGSNGSRPHGDLLSVHGYDIGDSCEAVQFKGLYGTDPTFDFCGISDGQTTLVGKPKMSLPQILPKGIVNPGKVINDAQAIIYHDGRAFVKRDLLTKDGASHILETLELFGAPLYREMVARMVRLKI